jgi:hypothetical protein
MLRHKKQNHLLIKVNLIFSILPNASLVDLVVNQIGDTSVRAILEELFRDTLVTSLANHLTSENDMRSRYKRKKTDIEEAFNRTVIQLQEQKLPKERTMNKNSHLIY